MLPPDAAIYESWVDLWVDESPKLWPEWTGGYWSLTGLAVLYFRGTLAGARRSFLDKLEAWRDHTLATLGEWYHDRGRDAKRLCLHPCAEPYHIMDVTVDYGETGSYWESRMLAATTTSYCPQAGFYYTRTVPSTCVAGTDSTGYHVNIHSRMIPRSFVEQEGEGGARATLKWMVYNGGLPFTFNYFLGVAIAGVAADATAVHPSVRGSLWNMELFDGPPSRLAQKLREALPGDLLV